MRGTDRVFSRPGPGAAGGAYVAGLRPGDHNGPMRIAQLANFVAPHSGGMRVALDGLGREYVAAGHERLLIVPGPRDAEVETASGVVCQIASPRVSGTYRMIVRPGAVRRALRRFRPTNVECSDKWTLAWTGRWATHHGVGSVLFSHERLDDMLAGWLRARRPMRRMVGFLDRRIVPRFDRVVVASQYAAEEFARWSPRVRVVPLGVDLSEFRPLPPTPRDAGAPLRLVLVSRLSREKDPQLAIDAVLELHRRGVPVRLDVFGSGPDEEALRSRARGGPITFHGFIADRRELSARLGAADLSLSVSPKETFGLVVLEALASGTPVLTSNRGGAREIITPGAGVVDEPASGHVPWGAWAPSRPTALAEAIEQLIGRLGPGMRRAARQRAEQFSWQDCAHRMLQVHRETRGNGGGQ